MAIIPCWERTYIVIEKDYLPCSPDAGRHVRLVTLHPTGLGIGWSREMTPRRGSRISSISISFISRALEAYKTHFLRSHSLTRSLAHTSNRGTFTYIQETRLTLNSPTQPYIPKMATSNNPSTAEITQHVDFDPTTAQRVSHRAVPQQPPTIQEPDPAWPSAFAELESRIRRALGDRALYVNHVGSTSVPGLPAKPVIDVDIVVADPADEAAYVSRLVGEGWDAPEARGTGMGWPEGERDRSAGLQFILREPAWLQHRFFVCADPVANVHVFGPGSPEVVRHRMFRDWLIEVSE